LRRQFIMRRSSGRRFFVQVSIVYRFGFPLIMPNCPYLCLLSGGLN
ncbi:uncharacterized protein METZ01_LOCUS494506, partial [marine metagenome]